MRYTDEVIVRQLRLREDSNWEFQQVNFSGNRPAAPSRSVWADEIAAFANAGGGVLLCGVSDDGEVQGMSPQELAALDSLISEVASDSIRPPVRIRTEHRVLGEKQRFLLVEVPKGESQHDSPGGAFIRVGNSKRQMSSAERLRLAQRRSQANLFRFDDQTVPGTGFETLREALWKPLLSAEGAANPQVALRKLALLALDEAGTLRATVAGVLLCTRTPERWIRGALITATHYAGADRAADQLDAQEITGPLNRQIADAIGFALRNMRVAARKAPGRVDLPQYSARALFEGLTNAVAHRDYSAQTRKIRLAMFEDRLEIQSPGSLPNNLTVESMAALQATRNPTLASLLGRMPVAGIRGSEDRQYFMERRGDGVVIIQRETRELCGRLPEYRLVGDSEVCLSIPAAAQERSPGRAVVHVRCSGMSVPNVEVVAFFPNKTWVRELTDERGLAQFELHSTHLPMTVFAAAANFAAHVAKDWQPREGALAIDLEELPNGGSLVLHDGGGQVPSLRGRINPVRDSYDRTFVYTDGIAVNHGQQQPVYFAFGEPLRLTDEGGSEALLRIIEIMGATALVEYQTCAPANVREAGSA